jgi:C1A family cysteine protease
MRKHLLVPVLFVFGCAGSAQTGGLGNDDVGVDEMPLSNRDSVFRGAPANDSLPVIDLKADQVAPKNTELLQYQSPVRNQSHRGVCTIFSTTALMEHLYIKAGMANPDFSEQYLQWSVKKQLGRYANEEGSNNEDNVEALARFGGVEESVWPYNPNQWTEADDPDCKVSGNEGQQLPTKCWTEGDPPAVASTAKKYTLPHGSWLSTSSIKSHIATDKTAVTVGLDFYYQAWNHGLSTLPISQSDLQAGIVRYPNADDVRESEKHPAGHGILIVGWDDTVAFPAIDKDGHPVKDAQGNPVMQKGFYIFKNSWGTSRFGVNNPNGAGYGYIQYKYIEEYGRAFSTTVPTLGGGPTCEYKCSDYGYAPNECYQGWQCDAQGQCLSNTGCRN